MTSPTRAIKDRFMRFATGLRFPRLLALAVTLFILDLFLPDLIPFADEILLGLVAALLAVVKKSRRDQTEGNAGRLPAATLPPKL